VNSDLGKFVWESLVVILEADFSSKKFLSAPIQPPGCLISPSVGGCRGRISVLLCLLREGNPTGQSYLVETSC
jgi:hypothetical protein